MDTGEDGVDLLSERITGGALRVLHAPGTGFLEEVCENALMHDLRKPFRNSIPWSFDTMGSSSEKMQWTNLSNALSWPRKAPPPFACFA